MRFLRLSFWLLAVASLGWLVCGEAGRAQAPAVAKPGTPRAAAKTPVQANLVQVMRGILFPNVNVLYAAQNDDPSKIKLADDPSTSPNPLTGMFGGWQAVENSGLALTESARLLTVPRLCSNGKPVPVQNPDWIKFVQGLRQAGLATYKAGQSKSQDALGDASDKVTTACQNCHDVYREKTDAQGGLAARCTK